MPSRRGRPPPNSAAGSPAGPWPKRSDKALLGAVRASDTVARFGGDEFGVLLHDAPDDQALATLIDRMVATVSAPIIFGGGRRLAGPGTHRLSRTSPLTGAA